MGGADIFIKGSGMAQLAPSNFPQYVVTGLSNLVVPGATINDDESFLSSPINGRLALKTPSLLTLLSATWDQFDGTGSLPTGHDGNEIYLRQELTTSTHTSPALGCAT